MELSTLRDAEAYLDGLINLERGVAFDYERLGLARIRALLAAIGHPEKGLPCVHVAGSNGKGSVSLATEALLRAEGLRVGTYTSPHLESWRERFRVDGEPVGAHELLDALRRLQPAIEAQRRDEELCPSFFDVSTALAFALFRDLGVEAGVIEVGLGGRLDSTNVVESRVSVITTIQLEHTEKLGDTLEQIAMEKAGILRKGIPVVHGVLASEAFAAIAARAVAQDAPLEEAAVGEVELARDQMRFRLADGRRLTCPPLGAHQAVNLALAVRASEHFLGRPLSETALDTLRDLVLPARIERFGSLILDCAHTPDAARALRACLERMEPKRGWVLAISISADKDAAGIFAELAPHARACVLTTAERTRSLPPDELEPLAWASGIERVETRDEPWDAVCRARELAGPDDLVVVVGSVYFAGAVRARLVAERDAG